MVEQTSACCTSDRRKAGDTSTGGQRGSELRSTGPAYDYRAPGFGGACLRGANVAWAMPPRSSRPMQKDDQDYFWKGCS
jgi:hypothetical protein